MKPILLASLALASMALGACGSEPGATGAGGGASTTTAATAGAGGSTTGTGSAANVCTALTFGDDRPVQLHVPSSYSCDKAAPLVILLHGYGASGSLEDAYLQITAESSKRGFLYAHPDGTMDTQNDGFWNATDACCNLYGSTVDDSAYLSKLITDIESAYNVDPKRVYLIGHSNGGFMSYRMACDHGDQIAAIASLAGAMFEDVTQCAAKSPVSVLEIHGTADGTIAYEGGQIGQNAFPSAETTVKDWATIDKCDPTPDTSAPPIDIEATLAGAETQITTYPGCTKGTGVELWTVQGGSHIPNIADAFIPDVVDFLYAHPKP